MGPPGPSTGCDHVEAHPSLTFRKFLQDALGQPTHLRLKFSGRSPLWMGKGSKDQIECTVNPLGFSSGLAGKVQISPLDVAIGQLGELTGAPISAARP